MYGQSGSFGNQDPTVTRIIEETLTSVADVERRLQALKVGIAQNVPQIAPLLAQRELQTAQQMVQVLSRLSPAQGPGQLGQLGGFGQLGVGQGTPTPPFAQGFSQGNVGFGTPFANLGVGVSPFALGATPFATGVTGPVSPFLGGSFRPW